MKYTQLPKTSGAEEPVMNLPPFMRSVYASGRQVEEANLLLRYHCHPPIETTFSIIQAKFGATIRSKTDVAQANELLCKVLCHNICCVIQSMYELGIEAQLS